MLSLSGKKWKIQIEESEKKAIEKLVLLRKDLFANEINVFHDPFLFKDMRKAVDRIKKAITNSERIIVFGDYDVDGITGTTIVYRALKTMGANVSYRIPHRVNDGYGLSEKFILEFLEKNINLLITVDCGISCKNLIDMAQDKGLDVIVTDHHTVPNELPNALAILHPKIADSGYPYAELTGAGVAFKLSQALAKEFDDKAFNEELRCLADFAALGTVADLGPLNGENRLIVKEGLTLLNKTKWVGLKKIIELAGIREHQSLDTASIGFRIAPRINASGRIGNPYVALGLLLQDQPSYKLDVLGKELEELNTRRKNMTDLAMKEAEAEFEKMSTLPPILIAESKDWHIGIVGLVAGRLAQKFYRPAIILQDFGEKLVASARSPEFFNVIEAIADSKDLLEAFGGHSGAAGFTVQKKNFPAFREKITNFVKQHLSEKDFAPTLKIDCPVYTAEINFDLFREIENLAPFGIGNERPVLMLNKVTPKNISKVGREQSHLKFVLQEEKKIYEVIAFGMGHLSESLSAASSIDLAFTLEKNEWNGKETLLLQALDIRLNQ